MIIALVVLFALLEIFIINPVRSLSVFQESMAKFLSRNFDIKGTLTAILFKLYSKYFLLSKLNYAFLNKDQ